MSAEPVISTGDVERFVLDTCVRGGLKSGPASVTVQEKRQLDFRILVEPPLPSATITDLCNEPLFYSGYLSSEEEEEEMSADDASLSSIGSVADEFIEEFEVNFPELLAEDCTFVEQQCKQAEAITLVSPGKPRMVCVSRVDLSSSPLVKRPASSSGQKHSRNSSRLSIVSLRAHSHDGSLLSNSPKMPSTPELEAAGSRTPESCHAPATPDSPASAYFDALTSPIYDMTPTPKTRARNPHRLRLSHMSKRPDSFQSMDAPLSAPLTKPKMIARDAGERMASLDLPPFPRGQIKQLPKPTRPWTIIRRDSVNSMSSKEVPRFSLRRVESGILPSWR